MGPGQPKPRATGITAIPLAQKHWQSVWRRLNESVLRLAVQAARREHHPQTGVPGRGAVRGKQQAASLSLATAAHARIRAS